MAARKTARRRRPQVQYIEHDEWHLDKRVPIALIVTIIMQGGLFVYGWAQMQSAIKKNTETTEELRGTAKERDKKLERLIVLEADIGHVRSALGRLEKTIDKILTTELERAQEAARYEARSKRVR